jgi:hypothetical protein
VKIYFLFGLIGFFFIGCNEKPKENNKEKTHVVFEPAFKGLDAFLNYQKKIEQRKNLKVLPSLLFTHKSGYILKSKVYLDPDGEILKASVERSDTNGMKVTSTFYFLKEVLSMVQVDKENLRLSELVLQQTRVFYDAAQRPIAAYYRKVSGPTTNSVFQQKQLNAKQHAAIQKDLLSISDMQNQEGAFTLYFQGFDEAFNKKFVQFGNTNFSTNLAYAPNESGLMALEKNSIIFPHQDFKLQHQDVKDASGLQYQVLTSIQKK